MIVFNIIITYLTINGILGIGLNNYLDKKTRYKDDKFYLDEKYILLFLFCCVFCLLFIKQIRHNRKNNFLKKYIKQREDLFSKKSNSQCEQYLLYNRLLKLEKLL